MKYKETGMGMFVSFATIAVAVVGVEGLLRIVDYPKWDTEITAGWRSHVENEALNEFGFRGQPIRYADKDFVIVLLGDSQVEAAACPPQSTPERLLEHYLSASGAFKVFTIGTAGYGNDQEYLALQEYLAKHRADMVLLWQTFSNDVWNNVFPTHMPKDGAIKPTYVLKEDKLEGPNYQLGEVVRKPAQTKIGVFLNRIFNPQKGLDEYWERFLPPPYAPFVNYSGPVAPDWDPADPENRNPFLENENLKTEKSHFAISLYPASKRTAYGLALTRKLLANIESLSKSRGAAFFVLNVTTPVAEGVTAQPAVVTHRRDSSFYQTSFQQQRANQATVYDGFPSFSVNVTMANWRVSETDAHLNCMANDEAMQSLARNVTAFLKKDAAP
jgi:hypothetical protein